MTTTEESEWQKETYRLRREQLQAEIEHKISRLEDAKIIIEHAIGQVEEILSKAREKKDNENKRNSM